MGEGMLRDCGRGVELAISKMDESYVTLMPEVAKPITGPRSSNT